MPNISKPYFENNTNYLYQ